MSPVLTYVELDGKTRVAESVGSPRHRIQMAYEIAIDRPSPPRASALAERVAADRCDDGGPQRLLAEFGLIHSLHHGRHSTKLCRGKHHRDSRPFRGVKDERSNLGREFATLAEAGGDDARALVERLTGSLESAIRMTLLDALSAAADEITRDLAPGSVELRLRGRDPNFVVALPPTEPLGLTTEDTTATTGGTPDSELLIAEDGPAARINVRLPEQLKAAIEEAAAKEGRSVNAWLGRAATPPAGAKTTRRRRPRRRSRRRQPLAPARPGPGGGWLAVRDAPGRASRGSAERAGRGRRRARRCAPQRSAASRDYGGSSADLLW